MFTYILVLPVTLQVISFSQPDSGLRLVSPMEYEVFQRGPDDTARIRVSGTLDRDADRIEIRALLESGMKGEAFDWRPLIHTPGAGEFMVSVRMKAGGWYRLEIRAVRDGEPTESAVVERVGVGEVLIASGQSNSTNCGDTRTRSETGMVSVFTGKTWVPAEDPIPGVHDRTGGGSVYPTLGDELSRTLGIPVAIASTGHGGQPVQNWIPGNFTGLYEFLRDRILALGDNRPRCVLWHQGESNSFVDSAYSDRYFETLKGIIEQLNEDIGYDLPWITCKVSYIPDQVPNPNSEKVREEQQRLWDEKVTLQGPDTDAWRDEFRSADGIHFGLKGLNALGKGYHDWIVFHFMGGPHPEH